MSPISFQSQSGQHPSQRPGVAKCRACGAEGGPGGGSVGSNSSAPHPAPSLQATFLGPLGLAGSLVEDGIGASGRLLLLLQHPVGWPGGRGAFACGSGTRGSLRRPRGLRSSSSSSSAGSGVAVVRWHNSLIVALLRAHSPGGRAGRTPTPPASDSASSSPRPALPHLRRLLAFLCLSVNNCWDTKGF